MIEVEKIAKVFNTGWPRKQSQSVLDDVSFSLLPGRTFGLMGRSGIGKTTLGRIVAGLVKPSYGEVYFRGKNIFDMNRQEWLIFRRKVQMLFQDPQGSLNPKKRIENSLHDVLNLIKIPFTRRREMIGNILQVVGLSADFLTRYPSQLSGGQNQRVALARILLLEPEFIILDEPTSALDISVQAQILNLLRELQQTHGLGYLFIAHDPEVIRYMSHTIGVLGNGTLNIVKEDIHAR
jgi:peptide/nickel transport system ATP-binding protein